MATATATAAAISDTAGKHRRRFSAAERNAMVKAGIIAPDEGTVLHDGLLLRKHGGGIRLFNVDEYYALAEAGIVGYDERVELLDGEIVTMAAMGSRHAAGIRAFDEFLGEALGRRVTRSIQCPLRLSHWYEPEPDIALLRRRDDAYAGGHPAPADALLLVEVADSSVRNDRRRKLPVYALFGIPEVWLADLPAGQVEIHDRPTPAGYARTRVVGRDGWLTPAAFPDIAIAVANVLPQ